MFIKLNNKSDKVIGKNSSGISLLVDLKNELRLSTREKRTNMILNRAFRNDQNHIDNQKQFWS